MRVFARQYEGEEEEKTTTKQQWNMKRNHAKQKQTTENNKSQKPSMQYYMQMLHQNSEMKKMKNTHTHRQLQIICAKRINRVKQRKHKEQIPCVNLIREYEVS